MLQSERLEETRREAKQQAIRRKREKVFKLSGPNQASTVYGFHALRVQMVSNEDC